MAADTAYFFDLDDTLYKERTFVASAYRAVARYMSGITGADPARLADVMAEKRPRGFEAAIAEQQGLPGAGSLSVDECVRIYRSHWPDIHPDAAMMTMIRRLKAEGSLIGIITDGTILTQGIKIRALGLDRYAEADAVFISEAVGGDKTTDLPWRAAEALCRARGITRRVYVGDNLRKDFLLPNLRGWHTVMLRDSRNENIFPQIPSAWPASNKPAETIFAD